MTSKGQSVTATPLLLRTLPVDGSAHAGAVEWIVFAAGTVARAVLALAVGMLLWATLPALWGWTPTTVSSGSMSPGIRTGDVVVSMPVAADSVAAGRVLLVDDPDHEGRLRLHRVRSVSDGGDIELKGDANPTADRSTVTTDDVHGAGVLRIPGVGLPGLWARQGDVVPVVGSLALAAGLVGLVLLDGRFARARSDDPDAPSRRSGRRSARPRHWTGHGLTIVSLAVVAVVAAAVVVAAPASSAFSATTAAGRSSVATGSFACLARNAYPNTFFRYDFHDAPGTVTADTSGNRRDGTLTSGASLAAGSCTPGNSPSLRLNGLGEVRTRDAVDAPQTFALETWFRTTTTTGGYLLGFGDQQTGMSTKYDRMIWLDDDGAVHFGVYDGANVTLASTMGLNDDRWHLVTATMDQSGMTLYVDGVRVAANATSRAESKRGWWRIGYDNLNGWTGKPTYLHFTGNLDATTVYSASLTADEVRQHQAAGR